MKVVLSDILLYKLFSRSLVVLSMCNLCVVKLVMQQQLMIFFNIFMCIAVLEHRIKLQIISLRGSSWSTVPLGSNWSVALFVRSSILSGLVPALICLHL